jgi:hypothetical protein
LVSEIWESLVRINMVRASIRFVEPVAPVEEISETYNEEEVDARTNEPHELHQQSLRSFFSLQTKMVILSADSARQDDDPYYETRSLLWLQIEQLVEKILRSGYDCGDGEDEEETIRLDLNAVLTAGMTQALRSLHKRVIDEDAESCDLKSDLIGFHKLLKELYIEEKEAMEGKKALRVKLAEQASTTRDRAREKKEVAEHEQTLQQERLLADAIKFILVLCLCIPSVFLLVSTLQDMHSSHRRHH